MKNIIIISLSIIIILLSIILCVIWNTDYTYCTNDICTYQKIGDYLLGKD